MLTVELIEVLTCPSCGGPVIGEEVHVYCANEECRHRFPVTDQIPVMSSRHGEVLEEGQWLDVMNRNEEYS